MFAWFQPLMAKEFIFHQKVEITGFSRSALAVPIGSLGIVTGVGKDWFSSLARGAEWLAVVDQGFGTGKTQTPQTDHRQL
ncbi:MAG: hypothetical protein ABIX00_07965 [Polaromonas sp.]